MGIKIERSGDDLWLPLPEHLIEQYGLKEGDEIDGERLAQELEKAAYGKSGGGGGSTE